MRRNLVALAAVLCLAVTAAARPAVQAPHPPDGRVLSDVPYELPPFEKLPKALPRSTCEPMSFDWDSV